MEPIVNGDLMFSFQRKKDGTVTISRSGRVVNVLRGAAAQHFLAKADGALFAAQQQLMARVSGNYKHGNEPLATVHSRGQGTSDA